MSASVIEQILARVAACLAAAGLSVFRGRVDAFNDDELPAVNLRRADSNIDAIGTHGERISVGFDIEHYVTTAGAWESAADALHMQVHATLLADAPLAALGRGLRCTATDTQGESTDRVIGRLTARYQMQVFVRPGDFTRAIS
ncbi:MAG: hypothetical protein KKF85_03390 [Gammaproteobacteria bacterium]|nr:hypothetical protein [Rhodocyclaceae bacterium]MBU3908867.1 hypothetical protein [Gammaproteobacteria bacterium]MBU3987734.1 hypothetical protein [Gammaproteobacteria bacterium]MBU4003345.1 hypothetical protein [Gammaproteobacteria bacterium]MBU4021816.1 hypothetical protein [Gammaproteobacteria bacterium]